MNKKSKPKEDVKIKIKWSVHELIETTYETYVNAPKNSIEEAISKDSSIEEFLEDLDIDVLELEENKKFKVSKVDANVHELIDIVFHNDGELQLSKQLKRANHVK